MQTNLLVQTMKNSIWIIGSTSKGHRGLVLFSNTNFNLPPPFLRNFPFRLRSTCWRSLPAGRFCENSLLRKYHNSDHRMAPRKLLGSFPPAGPSTSRLSTSPWCPFQSSRIHIYPRFVPRLPCTMANRFPQSLPWECSLGLRHTSVRGARLRVVRFRYKCHSLSGFSSISVSRLQMSVRWLAW